MSETQVTGTQIKRAIRLWRERVELLKDSLANSEWTFEPVEAGSIRDPFKLNELYVDAFTKLCQLQELQQRWNALVTVVVNNNTTSVATAVKLQSFYGALASTWRNFGKEQKRDSYYRNSRPELTEGTQLAKPAIPREESLKLYSRYSDIAASMSEAVAVANATSVLMDFDASLLETPPIVE